MMVNVCATCFKLAKIMDMEIYRQNRVCWQREWTYCCDRLLSQCKKQLGINYNFKDKQKTHKHTHPYSYNRFIWKYFQKGGETWHSLCDINIRIHYFISYHSQPIDETSCCRFTSFEKSFGRVNNHSAENIFNTYKIIIHHHHKLCWKSRNFGTCRRACVSN